MFGSELTRLKNRLAAARADVEGLPSARELEIAAEEIEALWEELGHQADSLARERGRNAAVFDCAPFACLISDAYGNIREANTAALALIEVPSAYAHGKPLAIFIALHEREDFRFHLAMAAGSPSATWSSCIQSSNGRSRPVTIVLRPMPRDEENSIPLLWFLSDIE